MKIIKYKNLTKSIFTRWWSSLFAIFLFSWENSFSLSSNSTLDPNSSFSPRHCSHIVTKIWKWLVRAWTWGSYNTEIMENTNSPVVLWVVRSLLNFEKKAQPLLRSFERKYFPFGFIYDDLLEYFPGPGTKYPRNLISFSCQNYLFL